MKNIIGGLIVTRAIVPVLMPGGTPTTGVKKR
jgi:hypothetical protein